MSKAMSEEAKAAQAAKVSDELTVGLLKDQLKEMEEQKLKLILSLKECQEKLEQQKSDQADIYYYLNKKLDDNYEVITSLEEQILSEQADREAEERAYERKIDELKTKLGNDEARYLARIGDLEEKLHNLKEFSEQKSEIDKNLDKLLSTLEEERAQFRNITAEMERRAVQDRDRLKRDFDRQLETYKQSLQSSVEEQLSKKTKRTHHLNNVMKAEISYQSKQADKVLEYNNTVLEKDKEMRIELDITQETHKEMVKKLALYKRLIKQLNERIAAEEEEHTKNIAELKDQNAKKDAELVSMTERFHELKEQVVAERGNLDAFWLFLSRKYKALSKSLMFQDKSTSDINKMPSSDNNDRMICELLRLAYRKYPESIRFMDVLSSGDAKTGSMFPPVRHPSGTTLVPAGDMFQNDLPGNTGISSWDAGRNSKSRWWKMGESVVDSVDLDEGVLLRNVAVQTEGHIVPYASDSIWLHQKPTTAPGASREEHASTPLYAMRGESVIEANADMLRKDHHDPLHDSASVDSAKFPMPPFELHIPKIQRPVDDPLSSKPRAPRKVVVSDVKHHRAVRKPKKKSYDHAGPKSVSGISHHESTSLSVEMGGSLSQIQVSGQKFHISAGRRSPSPVERINRAAVSHLSKEDVAEFEQDVQSILSNLTISPRMDDFTPH